MSQKQKFSQQNLLTLEKVELMAVVLDTYVTYGTPPEEHAKVVAIFQPCLDDNDPDDVPRDEIAVVFYDKVADIIAESADGTIFTISAKVKSRMVQPKDQTADAFPVTEVVGYYAEVYGSKRHKESERRRANDDGGKKPQADPFPQTKDGNDGRRRMGTEKSAQTYTPRNRR